jgi:hypothetical protein
MQLQEKVKNTPIAIPFVFFDGSNIPGGVVRVTKGEYVWVFLDGSRKVGAEVGAGVSGEGKSEAKARREWARVGVDDLMLVRGEIIIPHVSSPRIIYYYSYMHAKEKRFMGEHKLTLFAALRLLLLHHQSHPRP